MSEFHRILEWCLLDRIAYAAAIAAEVRRRVGPAVPVDLIKLAVDDALQGHRQPRW
jgi:hypothetical protein